MRSECHVTFRHTGPHALAGPIQSPVAGNATSVMGSQLFCFLMRKVLEQGMWKTCRMIDETKHDVN